MKNSTTVLLVGLSLVTHFVPLLRTSTNSSIFQQLQFLDAAINDAPSSNQPNHGKSTNNMNRGGYQQQLQNENKHAYDGLDTRFIPLDDLVDTSGVTSCPDGFVLMNSTDLQDRSRTHPPGRKIPKLVHVTSKSRCMHPHFVQNLEPWQQFENYSFFFHDDEAIDRLMMKRFWPAFPSLQLIQPCLLAGAAKADLWRLLVLWEYGGLYTDIDNGPGFRFENATVITDDTDAWFVVERIGVLSQYFMAASPRHPLIHLALQVTIDRVLNIESIKNTYVAVVTGPSALREATKFFLKSQGTDTHERMVAGHFVGVGNRSITVEGTPRTSNEWIHRESLHPFSKRDAYVAMGMKHFTWVHKGRPGLKGWKGGGIKPPGEEWNISCHEQLYNQYIASEAETW